MDEKMFDLMAQMYNKINDMEEKMATKQDLAKLEQKYDDKMGALFDGLSSNTEAVNKLTERLDQLTDRVERQEIKLKWVQER